MLAPGGHHQRAFTGLVQCREPVANQQIDKTAGAVHTQGLTAGDAAQPDGAGKLIAHAGQYRHGDAEHRFSRGAEHLTIIDQGR